MLFVCVCGATKASLLVGCAEEMSYNEDIDKHVLRKYEIGQKLGKGVCYQSISLRIFSDKSLF